MKLSHLLVTDPLYNHPADTIYTEDRQNDIHRLPRPIHLGHKRSHIQLYRRPHQTIQPHYRLPTYTLQIAQLSISSGGLGFYNPSSRALTDLANTYIASWWTVLQGIRTHKDLLPRQLDPALDKLFTLESNLTSVLLQRIHSVIPNVSTIPRESCSQYFLDKLSPTSYKSRLKKVANCFQQYTLYNTFYNDNQDNIH